MYWFESLRRTIAQQPRNIRIADDFHCPSKEEPRWKVLQKKVLNGKDLNPHRSTAHRSLFNSDGLLAEWGVHHFHLGINPHPKLSSFVERSGPIVFALVDERTFYAINIYEHTDRGVFERSRIIESLHRNWPEVISKYRLRGIAPEKLCEEARRTVRKKGCQAPVGTADETVYVSIGGLTSPAGIKSESVRDADIWACQIRSLQNELQTQLCQLVPTLEQRGYTGEPEIEAELKITEDGYQAFFPKYRVRATLLLAEPI
ncbi:MAG: hypothetical protein LAO30_17595 [Acidobacteriia bacterium]|nr:hypothetical protein [Terriglobia bacterium]